MPFWKKEKKAAVQENGGGGGSNGTTTSNGSNSSGENGVGSGSSNGGCGGAWVKDPKVNYKARLEHKQYLVSQVKCDLLINLPSRKTLLT